MTVRELNPEQYKELCQKYITEFWTDNEHGTTEPSYEDLMCADELVSEDIIFNYYDGIEFVEEDFFCTMAAQEEAMTKATTQKAISYDEIQKRLSDTYELYKAEKDNITRGFVLNKHRDLVVKSLGLMEIKDYTDFSRFWEFSYKFFDKKYCTFDERGEINGYLPSTEEVKFAQDTQSAWSEIINYASKQWREVHLSMKIRPYLENLKYDVLGLKDITFDEYDKFVRYCINERQFSLEETMYNTYKLLGDGINEDTFRAVHYHYNALIGGKLPVEEMAYEEIIDKAIEKHNKTYKNKKFITGIALYPGKPAFVHKIENGYIPFTEFVGGGIEMPSYFKDESIVMLCNNDVPQFTPAKFTRAITNEEDIFDGYAKDDIVSLIYEPAFIMGTDEEGGNRSLTEEEIEKYLTRFKEPETLIKLGGKFQVMKCTEKSKSAVEEYRNKVISNKSSSAEQER